MEEMADKVVELANLAVLGEDEIGLAMHIVLNDDENAPSPENVPASTDKGEVVYNAEWGHDRIFRRNLTGARNRNPCVHFAPDDDPKNMQLFQFFFQGYCRGGVVT